MTGVEVAEGPGRPPTSAAGGEGPWPAWDCFPPFGDRVAHGYLLDADDEVWRSLCRTREVPDSDHDPRRVYLVHAGRKEKQPDTEDSYGCCAGCIAVADRRGVLPYRGVWPARPARRSAR